MENPNKDNQRQSQVNRGQPFTDGIYVSYNSSNGDAKTVEFSQSFHIGREPSCEVQLKHKLVSRRHVKIYYKETDWYVLDASSTNGTYLDGQPIKQACIKQRCELTLGLNGPSVWLEPGNNSTDQIDHNPESVTMFVDRYFGNSGDNSNTQQAQLIQQAFDRIAKRRTFKYRFALLTILLLLGAVAGLYIYQQSKIEKLYGLATEIFYTMKALELQLANQERRILKTGNEETRAEADKKRQELANLTTIYEQYLSQAGLFDSNLSVEDQLIFRVARVFGECELEMPDSFREEVKIYIKKWQSSSSLEKTIARAEGYDFIETTQRAMRKHDLPLQFFYLGVQESRFQIDAIGPETRHGIAKGPWQFIPSTAQRYGLNPGPLQDVREFDNLDDRFDISKSTYAAAHYLKDIYSTEAQASGLLVMASYNWGEHNIGRLLRQMPENPRERNFWKLINRFNIPEETYNYVLYIFAAAVIGENPRLFGFDFDNPFAAKTNAGVSMP